jgi:hypothetical protein
MHALTPLVNCVFNVSIREQFAARLARRWKSSSRKSVIKAAHGRNYCWHATQHVPFFDMGAETLSQYQYHSTHCMIFALQRRIIGIVPPQDIYFLLFSSSSSEAIYTSCESAVPDVCADSFILLYFHVL